MKKGIVIALASVTFSALAAEKEFDCDNAQNTLEINRCASIDLKAARAELNHYLDASFKHNSYDAELVKAIKKAQKDWQVYMSSHCDSIYTQWRDGTIRGVLAISCKTTLTKKRTYQIWSNFLTYMDSTPPVLPEPK